LFFSGPIPFMKGRADSDVPGTEERKGSGKWLERLEKKMTDLEERNKMEVDKLLDLFKKNPDEALKYAIPLDSDGTSRGRGGDGVFSLVTRWLDLSPFGRSNPAGGGGTVRMGDEFLRLNQQYQETARKLVKEGDYSKAAFIYLRLLKNYTLAAQTLEEGGLYGEAASVYLRYNRDKTKAAECYEKGGMVQPAIELYKELGKEEKVGDLYRSIDRREEANHYFEKVAGDYTARGQYMKASVVVRNKMEDDVRAQALLMDGWRNKKDAVNCLTGYFSHLRDEAALMDEMRRIYEKETDKDNRVAYLQVMKHTYQSREAVAGEARSIAYEIVAGNVAKDPSIVAELQSFNRQDKNIISDILKFKHSRR
ncbi:MAG TPA: hypothetical protein VKQ52_21195, partial [Puia sp.]|nr:hypothetical protein [Puia sp.]